jgi:hypothetical protein
VGYDAFCGCPLDLDERGLSNAILQYEDTHFSLSTRNPQRLTSASRSEHKVVSHEAWLAARKGHLTREKEFTGLRDQLGRERRELPLARSRLNTAFQESTAAPAPRR